MGVLAGSSGWWDTQRKGCRKNQRQREEIKRDGMGMEERQQVGGGEGKVGNELQ